MAERLAGGSADAPAEVPGNGDPSRPGSRPAGARRVNGAEDPAGSSAAGPVAADGGGPRQGGDDLYDLDDRSGEHHHVLRGSSWYVGAVIAGAALSFLYWAVAAHLAPQETVGVATALWAAVLFLNYATQMGLPVAVARFGSVRAKTANSLFLWALAYTTFTSVVGTVGFAMLSSSFVQDAFVDALFAWGTGVGLVILFFLVCGMAFAILVEVRLVTMRRWGWVLGRVLAISLVRFPFLLIPAVRENPLWLLLLIAGPPALSGYLGALALHLASPRHDRGRLFPLPDQIGAAMRYSHVNYLGMLAAQAPQFIIPLVVAAVVTPEQNGAFYLAWSVTVVVFLIPHTIGQVVLSEGSRDLARLRHQAASGLRFSLGLMIVMSAGAYALAGIATELAFGADYGVTESLLPRLVAAGIPWAVTSILLARARAEADHLRTVVITLGFAVITLIPTTIATQTHGVEGTATAWFLTNVVAALVAGVATRVLRPKPDRDLVGSSAAG